MGETTNRRPSPQAAATPTELPRGVPTASYNVLTHSKIGLPPLGEGLVRGFSAHPRQL